MAKTKYLKGASVIVAAVMLILIIVAFFQPWYNYNYKGSVFETFHGVTVGSKTLSWSDSSQPHLTKLYLYILTVFVFASFFQLLAFIVAALFLFLNYLPLSYRLGVRFMNAKVKKIALVVAVIEFLLLSFCVFYMLRHPDFLSQDLPVVCFVINACNSFAGSGFGPSTGWIFALISWILSILQLVITALYSSKYFRKMSKYDRIG